MAAVTAAVIGAGVALAGTAYQISEANNAKKDAKTAATQARARNDSALRQANAQLAKEEAIRTRDQAKMRVRAQAAGGGQGRASTILTSPLGVTGNAGQPGNKTILGS